MKKIVLLAGTLLLIPGCTWFSKDDAAPTTRDSSTVIPIRKPTIRGPKMSKPAKVAIVDMRTILSQDPAVLKDDTQVSHEWRDLYNKLQTTMQAPQQELAELQAQLQTKGKEFEALQKSGVSSQETLQKKYQQEIAPIEYKLQMQSQQVQRFVNDEFGKIQAAIFPKVQKAVDEVAKSQGWDFVVNREALISTVTGASDFNITSDALSVLNSAYAATKKQSAAQA